MGLGSFLCCECSTKTDDGAVPERRVVSKPAAQVGASKAEDAAHVPQQSPATREKSAPAIKKSVDVMFTPLRLGSGTVTLEHRVVLAPLTRCRASEPELAPQDMTVEYYSQRASKGGLLITEATNISPEAMGYKSVPGIWTAFQVTQWKKVADAVHAKQGFISMQLWHVGRVAHPSFGEHPLCASSGLPLPSVSSSPVAIQGKTSIYGSDTPVPHAVPRELGADEIPRLIQDYRRAARNAMKAGMDLVEIHGAHGYLIDQFLSDGINQRTDRYGGSIENRCRLLFEVVEAVIDEVGDAGRVAVRLFPQNPKDPSPGDDSDPDALFTHAIGGLDKYKLAYLLLTEPRWFGEEEKDWALPFFQPKKFRPVYSGPMFGSGGFTPINAREALNANLYDGVAFGRWFISNPDLPARLRAGLPLNKYNRKTFYTSNEVGYTDYPTYEDGEDKDRSPWVPQDKIGKSLEQLQA